MRRFAGGFFILFLSIVLGGCSSQSVSSKSPAPPKAASGNSSIVDYDSIRIIQMASDKTVLIDGTYYEITPASTISDTAGLLLQPEELHPGDLVFLTSSKETTGQFPGKGILLALTKCEDEMSKTISKAIAHVLKNQKTGDIIAPELKSVSSHLVTLQFKDRTNEQKYESIVNIKSLEFHVKEISDSTSKR